MRNRCITSGTIGDGDDAFKWVAHPQDDGSGYSYSIQMSDKPGDTIHVDTKSGTVFNEDEISAVRQYFLLLRERMP